MTFSSPDAPPLGQRPWEPTPGKESLQDPRGEAAAEPSSAKGPTCPDCGLPFGEHPDFHAHGGGSRFEGAGLELPGEELDPDELGGDPAGA